MTLIHAPKVTKIICPPLPGHIIHPPFHNGSKPRNSVPLRKPLSPCTLSTAPVRHLPSASLFHNGSKTHVSVPLRKPLSPCILSTAPVRHLPSVSHFHNGSKTRDSVPLRKPPSICNEWYFAKQQKLRALCRSRELQIEGVHLIVCFVVMGVCVCYIGIYVHRYKTDSVEKIQDGLYTPSYIPRPAAYSEADSEKQFHSYLFSL